MKILAFPLFKCSSLKSHISAMDSSVLTALRLGQSIIVGQCVGINPANGQSIVFSEDRVLVHVVPFDRVKIKTPLVRIRTGSVMPATIWGIPNISPMILGTLRDLKVKWSTNQPDVIDILDIFSEAGVEYEDIDSISVRVKAMNPGRAKIQADVETSSGRQTCYVDVTVFKMLELESPKRITSDAIIVPPNSIVNLKANLPDTSFKFAAETVGGLKISSDGVLRTSEAIGRDLVIVSDFILMNDIGRVKEYSQFSLSHRFAGHIRGPNLIDSNRSEECSLCAGHVAHANH